MELVALLTAALRQIGVVAGRIRLDASSASGMESGPRGARLAVIAASTLLGLTAQATGTEAEAMASQTIVETTTVEGRDRALANEVEITTEGGDLLIQWSLSYAAFAATEGQERGRRQQVALDLVAGLMRDGAMLATWHLDYGTARQEGDMAAVVQVKGTAGGALVDRAPAGRRRYRVEVWHATPGALGARSISLGSRTMIIGPP